MRLRSVRVAELTNEVFWSLHRMRYLHSRGVLRWTVFKEPK